MARRKKKLLRSSTCDKRINLTHAEAVRQKQRMERSGSSNLEIYKCTKHKEQTRGKEVWHVGHRYGSSSKR